MRNSPNGTEQLVWCICMARAKGDVSGNRFDLSNRKDAEVRVVPKDHDEEIALPQTTKAQAAVEQQVRGEIQKHASVVSIGEVRVGGSGNVDVTIRVNPSSTVQEANGLALQLIDSLQSHDSIESARIYLDLNEHMSIPIVSSS